MIRETILLQMRQKKMTQVDVSKATGIEYTAINSFLTGKKGMWFYRIQALLDFLDITAEGGCDVPVRQSISQAVWLEMKRSRQKPSDVARENKISYGVLMNFVNNRCGISVERAERLMIYLNIKLKPVR